MQKKLALLRFLIGLAIAVLIFGIMCKIMHWPGAGAMIIFSKVTIGVAYPYQFILKGSRTRIENLKVLCVFAWAISGVVIFYFEGPARNPLMAISSASFFAWLAILIYEYMLSDTPASEQTVLTRLVNIAFIVGSFLLIIGISFKIMHWPGAKMLMLTGTILGMLWLFEGFFSKEQS